MLRTYFWNQNEIKQLFEIQLQEIQMASKIHSGNLQRGQAKKKTFLKTSKTPQGPPLGNHLGIQNHSKPITEAL